ncbi:hypothetical protein [Okeania sp.]|uniref:hypothetical protein n=1 Tax=Okeania sp. TaxID=3100323 RepID=UPI002B4B79E2|nr:hypothetical protein [Okeania sp.]
MTIHTLYLICRKPAVNYVSRSSRDIICNVCTACYDLYRFYEAVTGIMQTNQEIRFIGSFKQ